MPKKTTEEFIKEAKEKHGNKYDYSKTVYTGHRNKTKIICPIHGEFECYPIDHIRSKSAGCSKCNIKKAYTTKEFIEEAKKIHGDKYDYFLVDYKNSYTKIKIICPIHGIFEQLPNNHLQGSKCNICYPNGTSDFNLKKKITKEEFIEKANKIHSNKYDYSLVNYINNKIKVKIICKIHGVFEQRPDMHLQGQGCPECGITKRASNQTKTIEDFIEEANKIHSNKYDYSKTIYKNNRNKVIIICSEHGEFLQTPNKHLLGRGCPKCSGKNRTTEEAVKILKSIYKETYDFSQFKYINATTPSKIRCVKHDYWFEDNFHKITTNVERKCCPKEWQSKANLLIKEILDKHNIKNIPEYTFKDCKYKKELPFDFYLPDYKIVIEYQGEWYFNDFKGNLKIQQKRDQIKREYCIKNNIKEVEINYWDFESLEKILMEKIS